MAKHLTDGAEDGFIFGQSASDPIGFYGTTPIAKPAVATLATTAATISQIGTSGKWGWSTSTAAKAGVAAIAALKKLGLV